MTTPHFRNNLHSSVFEDSDLAAYLAENTVDPWQDTPFIGYTALGAKQKGEFGERFISKIAVQGGHQVMRASSSTAGHDRVINGKKIEIKFALACRKKKTETKIKSTGYYALTTPQLKEILGKRGLKKGGNKSELVIRLEEWDTKHETDPLVVTQEQVPEVEDFGVNKDSFVMNHVSKGKDWDRLIFCGINPKEEDIRILWFNKEDFVNHMGSGCVSCFNTQQGGEKIQNDDYMCTNIQTLRSYDWVHEGAETAFIH